jgi:hypothetical protein
MKVPAKRVLSYKNVLIRARSAIEVKAEVDAILSYAETSLQQ